MNSCRLIHSFGGKPMLKLFKDFAIFVRWYLCISRTCDVRLSLCRRRFVANGRSHIPSVHENNPAFVNAILKRNYNWPVSRRVLFLGTRFVKFDNATDLTTKVLRFDSRTRKIFLSFPLSPNRSRAYTASYKRRTDIFCPTVKAVGSWKWTLTCV